jgi:hypothetical protein
MIGFHVNGDDAILLLSAPPLLLMTVLDLDDRCATRRRCRCRAALYTD